MIQFWMKPNGVDVGFHFGNLFHEGQALYAGRWVENSWLLAE
jgi:hypothetical protein